MNNLNCAWNANMLNVLFGPMNLFPPLSHPSSKSSCSLASDNFAVSIIIKDEKILFLVIEMWQVKCDLINLRFLKCLSWQILACIVSYAWKSILFHATTYLEEVCWLFFFPSDFGLGSCYLCFVSLGWSGNEILPKCFLFLLSKFLSCLVLHN